MRIEEIHISSGQKITQENIERAQNKLMVNT